MTLEEMFAKVTGRPPTESQRERLHRLRDALGLRENDAFWAIVMALEHYDTFFRAYPAQLAEVTEHAVENVRAACAAAAAHEVAAVQRALAGKVAETSVALARKLSEDRPPIHRLTGLFAAVVAFGALCVNAGYALALRGVPFWLTGPAAGWSAPRVVLATVLSVPAGWMVFALLVPTAIRGAGFGWRAAADPLAARRDQVVGWAVLVLCILAVAAFATVLIKLGLWNWMSWNWMT